MQKPPKIKDPKNKKKELVAPTISNPHNGLNAIFDPPTELSIKCLKENQRSFVNDRRFAGLRAAEIVEKKFGGFNRVTDEQVSQAHRQAWNERIAVCQALTQENKTPAGDMENPELKNIVKKPE